MKEVKEKQQQQLDELKFKKKIQLNISNIK